MVERADPTAQRGEIVRANSLFGAGASIVEALEKRPNALLALSLVALFLLTFPVWRPLTQAAYISGQEGPVPPILLYEMDRCFDDGQIPCRWAPDVAMAYGAPVFNYYGPLPYYVGQPIQLAGVGFFETIELLYIMAFLMAALFMFLLGREFWGNLGGLVSAVFLVYAPWQASIVYVQGSLAHHWALAFFPAVLWAAYKVIKDGKPEYVLLLSLLVFALLLTHNLLIMMFIPLAAAWSLTLLLVTKKWQRGIHLAIASVSAFSLAAFFTLPVLLERDLAHLDRALGGYYDYSLHFPRLKQLFLSRFWGYGPSVPGDADQMSFQIGPVHWAMTFVFVLAAPLLWLRSRPGFWAALVCFLFFWVSVFLMHPRSDLLWRNFSLLPWQLFPFRFLGLAIFTSSFLAGAILLLVKGRPHLSLLLSIALIAAVIGLNQEFFRSGVREHGQFSGPDWAIGPRTDVWVVTQPKYAATFPSEPAPAKVQVVGGDADITRVEHGSDSLTFDATSAAGAQLRASVADFPNWRVRLNGEIIAHDHANEYAAITFDLPPGSHSVALKLGDTSLRTFANYWSLISGVVWIAAAGALVVRAAWSAYVNARRRGRSIASRTAE